MYMEEEITVEVGTNFEELKNILEKNNFKVMEEYVLDDVYMIHKDIDRNQDYLDILKHCVLIRNIVSDKEVKRKLTYKYKEFNDKKEIVKQGKIDCRVESIEKTIDIFKHLEFEQLIRLIDKSLVYSNGIDEFVVQRVNDKHIYIEIEDKCNYTDRTYTSLEEMKDVIKKYNIPIIGDNYFAKKAEVEMMETFNN